MRYTTILTKKTLLGQKFYFHQFIGSSGQQRIEKRQKMSMFYIYSCIPYYKSIKIYLWKIKAHEVHQKISLKNKSLWTYFYCFSKLSIQTITDKQLLYHERVKSKPKSSFASVVLFTGEIIFQYHFTNACNLVKQWTKRNRLIIQTAIKFFRFLQVNRKPQ